MTDPYIEYERNHAVCPACGGWPGKQTSFGYSMDIDQPEKYQDLNEVWCSQCDWYGVIHDLVPERDNRAARTSKRFK